MVTGAWPWLGVSRSLNDWILPSTPLSRSPPHLVRLVRPRADLLVSKPVRVIPPVNLAAGGGGPGVLTVPLGEMVGLQLAYGRHSSCAPRGDFVRSPAGSRTARDGGRSSLGFAPGPGPDRPAAMIRCSGRMLLPG